MDTRNITITTLSPVHIGCGEDFVPTNFVIKDNLLYYLDMAVVADALDDSERNTLGGKQTIGAIQQFFKSRRDRFAQLSSHIVEVASGLAREYDQKAASTTQPGANGESVYNQIIFSRTAYRTIDFSPYLPGSSFKGSIRTAWLDTINGGRSLAQQDISHRDKNQRNRELQQKLLRYDAGKFEDDPFRDVRVSDAHHDEDSFPAPTCILYAVSKKKRPSERGASELKIHLEVIAGLLADAFVGEIRIGDKMTWQQLCNACNTFYWPHLERELEHAHLGGMLDQSWRMLITDLLRDEFWALRKNHQGFLLRVGRHSGAESMTLDGVRDIKILGKRGEEPTYRSETTEKRFASHTRAATSGLLPFGWVWVESCDDSFQYISAAIRDKLRPHSQPLREAQRCRINQLDEAREMRLAAAQAAEQQRKQAEETERREAHEKQAWQSILTSMSANMRRIEELRAEMRKRVELGRKIPISDQFYNQHIKALAQQALEGVDWNVEEKSALASMLREWAPRLVSHDAKDLRKRLKLSALGGQT